MEIKESQEYKLELVLNKKETEMLLKFVSKPLTAVEPENEKEFRERLLSSIKMGYTGIRSSEIGGMAG